MENPSREGGEIASEPTKLTEINFRESGEPEEPGEPGCAFPEDLLHPVRTYNNEKKENRNARIGWFFE